MEEPLVIYLTPDDKRLLAMVDSLLRRGALTIKLQLGGLSIETQHMVPDVLPRLPGTASKEEQEQEAAAKEQELERDLYGAT